MATAATVIIGIRPASMGVVIFFRIITMLMDSSRCMFVGSRIMVMVELRRMMGIGAAAGPDRVRWHCD